ncbi:unnamed protein product, partial [Candidula unifasciata]
MCVNMQTIVLLVWTSVAGTFCQTLTMTNPKVVSSCDNAALAGKDRFTCSGTGQDLAPQNPPTGFSSYIALQLMKPGENGFNQMSPLCRTTFSENACSGGDCITCTYSENVISIQVNRLLTTDESRAVLQIQWLPSHDMRMVVSDNNFTLPEIV